jgi:hypothetical protein
VRLAGIGFGRYLEGTEGKRSEPQAGCRAQQTCGSLAEEAVEVVRNHEDGTGLPGGIRRPRSALRSGLEWTRA